MSGRSIWRAVIKTQLHKTLQSSHPYDQCVYGRITVSVGNDMSTLMNDHVHMIGVECSLLMHG